MANPSADLDKPSLEDPAIPGLPPAEASLADALQAREAALRIAEKRYRRLFESTEDGVLLLNAWTAQIEEVNPALVNMLGYRSDELLGKMLWDLDVFQATPISRQAFAELQTKAHFRHDNLKLNTHDGRQIFVEFVSTVYECEGVALIQCNLRDISARVLTEKALRMTARALKVISEVNSALIRAPDEHELLREICRVLVEAGGYRLAWAGFAGQTGSTTGVQPLACYDCKEGFLSVAAAEADGEPGRELADTAISSGAMQFVEDIATDPRAAPWRTVAGQRGYRSLIALPFSHHGTALLGCVVIYGAATETWPAEERALLHDLTGELIYGIVNLRQTAAYRERESDLRDSLEQTVQALAATIDQRTAYSAGHQRRVADLCVAIARELDLAEDRIHGLRIAANIYDVGKIHIPLELLTKPARLNQAEFALIQEHCKIGFETIKHIRFPWPVAQTILQHHEHLDGSGYPVGIKGDELLLEARILCVADVVEAMGSHRHHRPAPGTQAALAELATRRGVWYDADVVDACVRLFNERGYRLPD